MQYPDHVVGWLYDLLEGIDWKWSIAQILETEREFPGLVDDLALEGWQRRLIKQQMDNENKDNGE